MVVRQRKDLNPHKREVGWDGAMNGVMRYMWNADSGEFMGRTSENWARLLLFYLFFYAGLWIFFILVTAAWFATVDKIFPVRIGASNLMKNYPGMGFRPITYYESNLIRFEQGNPASYNPQCDHIQSFLDQYENAQQTGEMIIDCSQMNTPFRKPADWEKSCRFNIPDLGGTCVKERAFGFHEGQPCILLKLNKMFDWVPITYNASEIEGVIPDQFAANYTEDYVYVTCEGENPADVENMGEIEIWPKGGFPTYFFPYRNQRGFRSPLVMVQFKSPANGVVIQIWCKAWAKNIYHHKNDRAGSVHFELLID